MAETSTATTIIPYLVCRNASEALSFYEKAFGAEQMGEFKAPDGRIVNAALSIGGALVYVCDEFPERGGLGPQSLGGTPVTMHTMVPDSDAAFGRAVEAGCTVLVPLADTFWGERYGLVADPYGHNWGISTKLFDPDPVEMQRTMNAM